MAVMTGTCSQCGEVKEGPMPTVKTGAPRPPFVCSECLRKKQSE
jgi:hypothetical protein